MIRIEADAIKNTEHEVVSAPIRLITNQSKIRVTLKRRVWTQTCTHVHLTPSNRNTQLNVQNLYNCKFLHHYVLACVFLSVCSTHSSVDQLWALRATGIHFSVGSLNIGSWLEGFILVASRPHIKTNANKLCVFSMVKLSKIKWNAVGSILKIWVLKSFLNLEKMYTFFKNTF